MLLDKLFLNILIVIAPVLFIIAFDDRRRHFKSPYEIGFLQGISSSLCLLFSYYAQGLYWDLRYVPLVISTVYGGPIAGFINFLIILITRAYLGGDAIFFGFVSITLTFLSILFFGKKIGRLSGPKRMKAVILVSLIPSIVMLCILISFSHVNLENEASDIKTVFAVLSFGLFQTLGVWLSSALQELYTERIKMKEEIQRTVKLKTSGEVAASIAHEIRNPLTVVQGFLQLMSSTIVEGKNLKYLQIALDELKRAEKVINDYLNFSKPKMATSERISLSDLIENIMILLTPLSGYKGVQFNSQLEEEIYLHTDRGQLQQALVNIIKNAVEASLENTVVYIKLASRGNQAELEIIDQGKGMTPEEVNRIGTLFYTTKENGTGLGTSVAVRIIEMMKGRIVYKSKKGEGTVCTILLPLE